MENETGINARKRVLFGKFDLATKQFTRIPLGPAGEAGLPGKPSDGWRW
jgi:hypothetical protein